MCKVKKEHMAGVQELGKGKILRNTGGELLEWVKQLTKRRDPKGIKRSKSEKTLQRQGLKQNPFTSWLHCRLALVVLLSGIPSWLPWKEGCGEGSDVRRDQGKRTNLGHPWHALKAGKESVLYLDLCFLFPLGQNLKFSFPFCYFIFIKRQYTYRMHESNPQQLMQLLGDGIKKGIFIFRRQCQFSTEGERNYILTRRVSKSLVTLGIATLSNLYHSDKWCSGL